MGEKSVAIIETGVAGLSEGIYAGLNGYKTNIKAENIMTNNAVAAGVPLVNGDEKYADFVISADDGCEPYSECSGKINRDLHTPGRL
ncbi:MAG: hypothetical protein LLG37_11250 [Spirochaetia bacterium]|nr:hypothetical protein [Spirochaetia bacterium]